MENYELLGPIGRGSFGAVVKVRRKSDNKLLVWKEIYYGGMSEKEKQQLVCEVNILRELRHPNIVRYYDRLIDKSSSKLFIVMEFCEGGDLGSVIKRCQRDREPVPEDLIWKILMQVTLALYECHKKKDGKILHRDLKPANVFLDAQMNVKLGDFGLSRVMGNDSHFAYTRVGSPYYMSPEQLSEGRYNEKSDIWSLGCLVYELACLEPPFKAESPAQLARQIREGHLARLPAQYSEELQRVSQWALSQSPGSRPSVEELLNLPEISLRIREKRLRENQELIQKKEEELDAKEREVTALEAANAAKERELSERESKLNVN